MNFPCAVNEGGAFFRIDFFVYFPMDKTKCPPSMRKNFTRDAHRLHNDFAVEEYKEIRIVLTVAAHGPRC